MSQQGCGAISLFNQHLFAVLGDLVNQPILCSVDLGLSDDSVGQVRIEEPCNRGSQLGSSVGKRIESKSRPALPQRIALHARCFEFLFESSNSIRKVDCGPELFDAGFLGRTQLLHKVSKVRGIRSWVQALVGAESLECCPANAGPLRPA